MFHHSYYGPGMGVGPGGGLIMGLLSLLFWVLVAWLIFRLFMRHGHGHYDWHHHDHAAGSNDPLAVAKMRYAKGEITKAELDDIRKNLAD